MGFHPVIKWIGSKRVQSVEIIKYFPHFIDTYYEPFCGGCSVLFTLLNSPDHYVNRCVCSDINGDLIDMWNTVKRDPEGLLSEYTRMWNEMNSLSEDSDRIKYFEMIRDEFNQTRSPYCFFFLMRTCNNGIPRYNRYGHFNNTLHVTRKGMSPKRVEKILKTWSELFSKHDVQFRRCDYRNAIDSLNIDDFVYFDPPYEITRSTGKYFGDIDYNDMFDRLRMIDARGIKFALSYDNCNDSVVVPDDYFENQVIISVNNAGYRLTELKLNSDDVYECLYIS